MHFLEIPPPEVKGYYADVIAAYYPTPTRLPATEKISLANWQMVYAVPIVYFLDEIRMEDRVFAQGDGIVVSLRYPVDPSMRSLDDPGMFKFSPAVPYGEAVAKASELTGSWLNAIRLKQADYCPDRQAELGYKVPLTPIRNDRLLKDAVRQEKLVKKAMIQFPLDYVLSAFLNTPENDYL